MLFGHKRKKRKLQKRINSAIRDGSIFQELFR